MRRMLATASIVAALSLIASPALADQTITIEHKDLFGNGHLSPILTERVMEEDTPVNTSIQGQFLWVSYDNDPSAIVSVDVSDPTIIGAVVRADGTVTLLREEGPEVEPQPEPETVDLVETYPETITKLPEFPVN